jgi:hypothetical protein
LIWELRTAMRLRAPESVLLTCLTDSSPKISPEVVRSRLQQWLGEVDLSPFPFFFYSKADRPRVRIKELREVLTQCIAHGPVIED